MGWGEGDQADLRKACALAYRFLWMVCFRNGTFDDGAGTACLRIEPLLRTLPGLAFGRGKKKVWWTFGSAELGHEDWGLKSCAI